MRSSRWDKLEVTASSGSHLLSNQCVSPEAGHFTLSLILPVIPKLEELSLFYRLEAWVWKGLRLKSEVTELMCSRGRNEPRSTCCQSQWLISILHAGRRILTPNRDTPTSREKKGGQQGRNGWRDYRSQSSAVSCPPQKKERKRERGTTTGGNSGNILPASSQNALTRQLIRSSALRDTSATGSPWTNMKTSQATC